MHERIGGYGWMENRVDFGGRVLDLSQPRVMGILNVTPDSFSDGGRYAVKEAALSGARGMVMAGADIIDVGGESTRPGALPVPVDEELERVVPVIEALVSELDVVVSVDTSKPEVMREAVRAGAGLINDVCALEAEGALEVVADSGLPVCLMHKKGTPVSMQDKPEYVNVVTEVASYLSERVERCHAAGIGKNRIILDPGFGFGKSLLHNFELFKELGAIRQLGFPLLVGVSRKSMIGGLLGLPVEERLLPSVVLAALVAERGAGILRVHDVRETVQALDLLRAVEHPSLVSVSSKI